VIRLPVPVAVILGLGLAFLYIPSFVLIAYSFNASALVTVWGGFSLSWYGRLLHDPAVLHAALLSLEVAFMAASIAVVLGTLAAAALVRVRRFPGRALLVGMVHAPLVVPEIITGITLLLLFVSLLQVIGWPAHRGFVTLVLAHSTFCMAYVAITVLPRLAAADPALEEAAMDLGAGPFTAFIDTTLPIIAPALLSGWMLGFILSLDDLVISSFVTGPGASTLPMVIYSKIKLGISPDMNALACLTMVFVTAAVVGIAMTTNRAERRRLGGDLPAGAAPAPVMQ
jgi:putrescine transport system permease protein